MFLRPRNFTVREMGSTIPGRGLTSYQLLATGLTVGCMTIVAVLFYVATLRLLSKNPSFVAPKKRHMRAVWRWLCETAWNELINPKLCTAWTTSLSCVLTKLCIFWATLRIGSDRLWCTNRFGFGTVLHCLLIGTACIFSEFLPVTVKHYLFRCGRLGLSIGDRTFSAPRTVPIAYYSNLTLWKLTVTSSFVLSSITILFTMFRSFSRLRWLAPKLNTCQYLETILLLLSWCFTFLADRLACFLCWEACLLSLLTSH